MHVEVPVIPDALHLEEAERKWADLIELSAAQAERVAKLLAVEAEAARTGREAAEGFESLTAGAASPSEKLLAAMQRDVTAAMGRAHGQSLLINHPGKGTDVADEQEDGNNSSTEEGEDHEDYEDDEFDDEDEEETATDETPRNPDKAVPAWAAGPTARAVAEAGDSTSPVSFSERSMVALEAEIEGMLIGGGAKEEAPGETSGSTANDHTPTNAAASTSSQELMEELERELENQIAAAVTPKRTRTVHRVAAAVSGTAMSSSSSSSSRSKSRSGNSSSTSSSAKQAGDAAANSQHLIASIETDIQDIMQRSGIEDEPVRTR